MKEKESELEMEEWHPGASTTTEKYARVRNPWLNVLLLDSYVSPFHKFSWNLEFFRNEKELHLPPSPQFFSDMAFLTISEDIFILLFNVKKDKILPKSFSFATFLVRLSKIK